MNSSLPRLGAHVSAAGGPLKFLERAEELGCQAAQLFVKNPNRWAATPIPDAEVSLFREQRTRGGPAFVAAHAAYLINLAATNESTRWRSVKALREELEISHRLGLDAVVLHPGAHLGAGVEAGVRAAAAALDAVLAETVTAPPILLENTAGQGTVLGARLEELAAILSTARFGARLGVCIDTCHAFAAGYSIHRPQGYEAFLRELERTVGLDRVACLHLNDSRLAFASRKDRHANIGAGRLGLACFHRIVNDPRLCALPMVIETPHGETGDGHRVDLDQLRAFVGRRRAARLRR